MNLEGNLKFTEKTEYNDGIAPGGYLLFSYNIADTKEKVQKFTKSVNDFYVCAKQLPPFLAIDHEGGYVNRLRKLYGNFLSQEDVANKLSEEQAYQDYLLQGKILKELGMMYVSDLRFKNNIDKYSNGASEYISKAIEIYCSR
mgnify:CR=1 FL=1